MDSFHLHIHINGEIVGCEDTPRDSVGGLSLGGC